MRATLKKHKQDLLKLLRWERERERRKLREAGHCDLIIPWSEYPTWIKLHDSLTGDWHEIKASECLPGVVETANKYPKKGSVE